MDTRTQFALELETAFKAKIKTDTQKMIETFTFEENMNIAYVPLVLTTMSFEYLHKVLQECASYKIQATKELTRAARYVEDAYWNFIRQDLDWSRITAVKNETIRFMDEIATDFAILWYSVNNEFKRLYPDVAYDEMRTDAIIARMMIEALREHQKRMNRLIATKMHDNSRVVENPYVTKLYTILDAFCGNCIIKNNEHMARWMQVFKNKINQIEFGVVA